MKCITLHNFFFSFYSLKNKGLILVLHSSLIPEEKLCIVVKQEALILGCIHLRYIRMNLKLKPTQYLSACPQELKKNEYTNIKILLLFSLTRSKSKFCLQRLSLAGLRFFALK